MITRADKGKTTVIIYTQGFTNEVHTFLAKNNFHTVAKGPTKKYLKFIQKTLKQCDKIISKRHIKHLVQKKFNPSYTKCSTKTAQT